MMHVLYAAVGKKEMLDKPMALELYLAEGISE